MSIQTHVMDLLETPTVRRRHRRNPKLVQQNPSFHINHDPSTRAMMQKCWGKRDFMLDSLYSLVSPRDAAELRALEDRVEAEVRQYRYDLWHEMDADVVRKEPEEGR